MPHYPGTTVFPGQTPFFNEALTIDKKDMEGFINRQKGHRHNLGRIVLLIVAGCVDYRDSFTESKIHHTGFYYEVVSQPDITPETVSIPARDLYLGPNPVKTGTID